MAAWRGRRSWHPEPSWRAGILLIAPGLCLLGLFFVWPLIKLLVASVPNASPKLYRQFFASPADVRSFRETFQLCGLVTIISLTIGSFLAWEMTTGGKWKRWFIGCSLIFPLLTSVVVRNYALTIILGRHGPLNNLLIWLGLRSDPAHILYTQTAVVIGMTYTLLPYAALPLYASFVNIDLDLLKAARSLGASPLKAFTSTVVPLAVGSFVATGALVFVLSLGFYVTPIVLGGGTSSLMVSRISNNIFVFLDLPRAAVASMILVAMAMLSMAITWRAVGSDRIRRAVAP